MAVSRPALQSWFIAFVAVTGVVSVFPYRQRALLPAPSANEQGLLAREISAQGTTDIVNDTIAGTDPRLARDSIGSAGARRLIPAQIRGTDVPGTSSLAAVLPSSAGTLPGGAGDLNSAPGGGSVNSLASANGLQGGVTTPPPGQTANNANPEVNGPQAPAALAGAASELLAAVVPEPSTWLMFIVGLMAIGRGLRRSTRASVRRPLQS